MIRITGIISIFHINRLGEMFKMNMGEFPGVIRAKLRSMDGWPITADAEGRVSFPGSEFLENCWHDLQRKGNRWGISKNSFDKMAFSGETEGARFRAVISEE